MNLFLRSAVGFTKYTDKNAYAHRGPTHTGTQPFTINYTFLGQKRECEVTEVNDEEAIVYKCRLLPAALEITIQPIQEGSRLLWIHNKGLVNDLASVLGEAIEQYLSCRNSNKMQMDRNIKLSLPSFDFQPKLNYIRFLLNLAMHQMMQSHKG